MAAERNRRNIAAGAPLRAIAAIVERHILRKRPSKACTNLPLTLKQKSGTGGKTGGEIAAGNTADGKQQNRERRHKHFTVQKRLIKNISKTASF